VPAVATLLRAGADQFLSACEVLAQRLRPSRAVIDVPLALAIVGLGVVIVIAPSSVPDSRHRCETSSVARATPGRCNDKKERTNDRPQDRNT
jgi:hypothetical protein